MLEIAIALEADGVGHGVLLSVGEFCGAGS